MATRKLYDLAVKTGSYTDRSGDQKNRYENVGSILQMDDGSKMILLKRSFNPAGVPFKEGSDQIIVSMFEPKDRDAAPSSAGEAPPPPKPATRPGSIADMDDDLAF
jgi:hypothetical protein